MANSLSTSQLLQLGPSFVIEAGNRQPTGLTEDDVYKQLKKCHSENASNLNLLRLFNDDPQRFSKYQ